MLADGTVVTFTDEKNAMRPGIMDVLNEWGPEGGTMEKITAASNDTEKERLMRGYLATLKNTDQVVKRWTLDAKYASITCLPSAQPARCCQAGSLPPRRRRTLDGRRRRIAVLRRGSPLHGGPQPRRHPAVRHDDRHADAGAVPDGVFGTRRTCRRQRHHLQALGIEARPRRRQGHAAQRLHRHEFLGGPLRLRGAYGKDSIRSGRPGSRG